MAQTNWEADKILDVYIHDYLVKRKLHASAKAFQQEAKIPTEPVAIDARGGFLFEWWSVFWDIFISRTNPKHSDAAASYLETQASKAREQQEKYQQQQIPMQQIMMQRQLQEQQRRMGNPSGNPNSNPINMRQNPGGTANAMATKMYQEKLKLPPQSDPSDMFPDIGPSYSYERVPEFDAMINARHGGSEGSFMGVPGSNQGGNSLTLKGWPLTGLDNLRPGQKTVIQSPHSMNQMQQQQQQMLLEAQAQQNLPFTSYNLEAKRLRMMLDHNLDQLELPNNSQQQSQNPQNVMSSPPPQQVSSPMNQPGSDQASKTQMGRKRRQPVSSSGGPANSSGTGNTALPSPPSAPSTPSTHTTGDAMSMQNLPHKPPPMFGADSVGTLNSTTNQVADDATLDNNVASFLSHEEGDARDATWRTMDETKGGGFTFKEKATIQASTSKVNCCHFSSDGMLLATGGHDKKAVIWFTESQIRKCILEEHKHVITNVRFSPSMKLLATSSLDKTVRVWDADNPGYSLRNFTGHSTSVMSVDFHPRKEDIICSNDSNGEVRIWSISKGNCPKVFEGATVMVRFQPVSVKYLAAVSEPYVKIIDVESSRCIQQLQEHAEKLHYVCWHPSGQRLACLSEDMIRVWKVGSNGGKWECVHELNSNGNKFNTCVFHPVYPSLLIIGCYQNLELWNMAENKTMSMNNAHEGLITSLSASESSGLVASTSHDTYVKIWQ